MIITAIVITGSMKNRLNFGGLIGFHYLVSFSASIVGPTYFRMFFIFTNHKNIGIGTKMTVIHRLLLKIWSIFSFRGGHFENSGQNHGNSFEKLAT